MSIIEIASTGMLEPTKIEGDMATLLNELNMAHAKNQVFIVMKDVTGAPVLLETRNITRARELPETESFM